jgi:pimeloyl-ACP methyl ester carboxylesterase
MLTQPVRDERVQINDLALHVVQWGDHGVPVICVHGLTANAFCFQAYADVLAADHRVIAYDLRGRGDSDKPESGYSVPIHAADLAHLITVLGLEKPVVIGHSLGAMISLYFATRYPELLSKLVLVDAGAPFPWKAVADQPQWLTNAVIRLRNNSPSYDAYVQQLREAPYLGPYWSEYLDLYVEHDAWRNGDGTVISKVSLPALIDEARHAGEVRPADELWSHVHVPTLLLRAGQKLLYEHDQLLPEESAQRIVQGIAHCQYVDFPTLNHYTIIFDAERKPVQAIQRFLEEQA